MSVNRHSTLDQGRQVPNAVSSPTAGQRQIRFFIFTRARRLTIELPGLERGTRGTSGVFELPMFSGEVIAF